MPSLHREKLTAVERLMADQKNSYTASFLARWAALHDLDSPSADDAEVIPSRAAATKRGRKGNDLQQWAADYIVVLTELGPSADEFQIREAMNLRGHARGSSQFHVMKAKAIREKLIPK